MGRRVLNSQSKVALTQRGTRQWSYWYCLWVMVWVPTGSSAEWNGSLVEGRLVTVEDGKAIPAAVESWRDAGDAIQLSVRDDSVALEIVDLLNHGFPNALVAVVGSQIFVSGVDLRPLLQGMSTMWLRSAPFENAPMTSFLGCVFMEETPQTEFYNSSTDPDDWYITSKGVGGLQVGKPIPDRVLRRLGQTRSSFFADAVENRRGFQVVLIPEMDLRVTFLADGRVLSISPGRTVRTPQGTGVGSTIEELRRAHPNVRMRPIARPYVCAAVSPALPHVAFHFTDCRKACSGEATVKTVVWEWPEESLL